LPAARRPVRRAGSELTEREWDVAQLVARGCSNREIAAALFVGERTIETHVGNILRKLAVPSRASVAAWVERQNAARSAT
jgi:non-specific serine/threonine protein kinase